MTQRFTTSSVPPGERLAYWTDMICDVYVQLDCDAAERSGFRGSIRSHRLAQLDLSVVDDGGAFIIYNISFTIDDEIYQQAPEAFDALAEALINNLENDGVTSMIYRIDVLGESRESVATDYLTQLGII